MGTKIRRSIDQFAGEASWSRRSANVRGRGRTFCWKRWFSSSRVGQCKFAPMKVRSFWSYTCGGKLIVHYVTTGMKLIEFTFLDWLRKAIEPIQINRNLSERKEVNMHNFRHLTNWSLPIGLRCQYLKINKSLSSSIAATTSLVLCQSPSHRQGNPIWQAPEVSVESRITHRSCIWLWRKSSLARPNVETRLPPTSPCFRPPWKKRIFIRTTPGDRERPHLKGSPLKSCTSCNTITSMLVFPIDSFYATASQSIKGKQSKAATSRGEEFQATWKCKKHRFQSVLLSWIRRFVDSSSLLLVGGG